MMDAEERRWRVWRVLLRRRLERGWEPVRREGDKRLIGWVRKLPHGDRISIDHADGQHVVLTFNDSVTLGRRSDVDISEIAWMIPDVFASAELLSIDPPYSEELKYEPATPDLSEVDRVTTL